MIFGALEAGGTKMVCGIGDHNGIIIEQQSFPTTTPEETIPLIIDFFQKKEILALGIGAFGPVDVHKNSPAFGKILDTPKLAWANFNLVNALQEAFHIPIGLDTDVNASCLGELTYGCAKGLDSVVYITIGTGIGAGISINGNLVHGMLHPEAGHILIGKHPEDDYQGKCPYHGDCFEGLASGPAIEERWGSKAHLLADKKEVWELEAYYIAKAIMNYVLILMPQKIILGGGVMKQTQLFPLIREQLTKLLSGYIKTPELNDLNHYIVPCSLNDNQGILGCIQLAKIAYEEYK